MTDQPATERKARPPRRREDYSREPRRVEPCEAKVRCNGRVHRVCFDGEHVHFPDHPGLKKEEALFQFGGRCRCLEVQKAWDQKVRVLIPDALLEAYDAWRMARRRQRVAQREEITRRNAVRLAGSRYLLITPAQMRAKASSRVVNAALAGLAAAGYRTGRVKHELVYVGGRPDISCKKDLGATTIRVIVGHAWDRKVLKAGLAVVAGQLVLDVLTAGQVAVWSRLAETDRDGAPWWVRPYGDAPDLSLGPYVLAGVQGRGCSIYPWPARVVTRDDGAGGCYRSLELYQKQKRR